MRFPLALMLLMTFAFTQGQRTFTVDYTHDTFLKDGKPFTFASGELHYFRVPKMFWQDRLQKIKLLGFNTVSTMVEWSLHEPQPGEYNFQGEADLVFFIKEAQLQGLNVILRPGPFVEGQRDFGGLPGWILMEDSDMRVRTSNAAFKFLVGKWYAALFNRITPLLYGNGGPVIMIQVENDYGSYLFHDMYYLQWLADLTRSYVKDSAVLFTSDTAPGLNRGRIPNVLSTIRFGTETQNITEAIHDLRSWQPHGPLVNSEFSTAQVAYWGKKATLLDTAAVTASIKMMLDNKFNFNCYMIAGGTNFAFTAGDDGSSDGGNDSIAITSYYNDAPLNEAGDITDKYMAIWALMKQYGWPAANKATIEHLQQEQETKGSFGAATLNPIVSLLNSPIGKPITTPSPLTMEQLHQNVGFIAYSRLVPANAKKTSYLRMVSRDRTIVLVNGVEIGVVGTDSIIGIPPQTTPTVNVTILVENLGRKDYQLVDDGSKGIVSDVTLDGVVLKDWQTVSYTFSPDDIDKIQSTTVTPAAGQAQLPAFFSGNFIVSYPYDTYLDMSGWGKGVAFVNGHNLGRYWGIGPQYTLYVPAVYLRAYPANNIVTVMELHSTNEYKTVQFIPQQKFDL